MHGFIVAAWDERPRNDGRRRIFATGRLADGRTFAVVMPAAPPAVYVSADVASHAHTVLGRGFAATPDPLPWTSFDGRPLARIALGKGRTGDAERRLADAGIHVHAIDPARATDTLLALGVRGPVELRGGTQSPGRRVDVVFTAPTVAPASTIPALVWLAIDIEIDGEGHVIAIALADSRGAHEVLRVGQAAGAVCIASERDLLAAFADRVRACNPDIITGWNVIDVDLRTLVGRAAALGIPLDLGRIPGTTDLRERASGRITVDIAGRAVVDARRIVRASGERTEDLSLDGAAHDPTRVLDILRTTGLDDLTVRRAALTGVALDLAWTSIPAFERVYGAALHARAIVPPPRTEAPLEAAGGTVLDATPGVFTNVLVFDFRSLYPSVMRTFHIDPLAHARARSHPRTTDVLAPNGARFDRTCSILPAILTAYAREREAALAAGDDTAAYVYKILQNSFYGVLGASGCRYAHGELAAAITSFGKHFLIAARDYFTARGYTVLYGDTDSVFVHIAGDPTADHATLLALATELTDTLNRDLTAELRATFDLDSHLRIRCDKIYRRFFISRLRNDTDGRGRGKGYAGLRLDADATTHLEVRGMEAVRSDFTPLARRFQRELLALLFADADTGALRAHCADIAARLTAGALDAELIYRKVLRRPAADYDSETPAVRAARLLGWTNRGGPIEYVMTRAGAEPVAARTTAPLDHAHYRDRQLVPIAAAIANILDTDVAGWFNEPGQLGLWG